MGRLSRNENISKERISMLAEVSHAGKQIEVI